MKLTNPRKQVIMKISKCLFLLFIMGSTSCHRRNDCYCDLLEKSLSSITYEEVLPLNKQIIPCLIDSIDTSTTSLIGFKDPVSSFIGNYHFNLYGIKYAYLVDYILSIDSIETVNKTWNESENFLHWAEETKPYRIYNIGIIVKQDENDKPILEPLTYDDMVKIKKMYFDWWEQNKDKPIDILKEEFRKGNKILQLPYVWI
ncbi:MAG: hypothetical protein LBV31_01855 [Prevotellaceae bacterium]|jgi:hypothetical protein|nr:hypothetical protein [Prevotellaceae bacterium]